MHNRAILITLRAAAIVIIATGLNDVVSSSIPRYEPLYLYLAGIALVSLLDGVILGLLTALLSLGFYALLFMPRADALTARLLFPAGAVIGTAVAGSLVRAVIRAARRRREPPAVFHTISPALLETSAVAHAASDNTEVLAAIDDLRNELRAAVADLTRARAAEEELHERTRNDRAEREAVEARMRRVEEERDWALRMRAEAERQIASLRERLTELEEAAAAGPPAAEFDELRRALADTRAARDRSRAETMAEKQRADGLERALGAARTLLESDLANERAARDAADAGLAKERAAREAAEANVQKERAAREQLDADLRAGSQALGARLGELESAVVKGRASLGAAESKLAEERAARERAAARIAELETALAIERAARGAAETKLTEEHAAAERAEARVAEVETNLAKERVARTAADTKLTEERAARERADARIAELETKLANERAARTAADTKLAEEGAARARAEARIAELETNLANERTARTAAETKLTDERSAREQLEADTRAGAQAFSARIAQREAGVAKERERSEQLVSDVAHERAARTAAESKLAAERNARIFAETNLGEEHGARVAAESKLEEERASRERLKAEQHTIREQLQSEFDAKLQTIVTHLASDHETDLGQVMSEKEEARAEARALSKKLATVQRKLEDAEALLTETRHAAQAEIDRLRAQVTKQAATPRPRVLVVHPDADVRGTAGASLERAGYEVVGAADGLEALRVAIAQQPEVVIAESSMPKMDGRELCQLLKSQEKTAHIRFILLMRAGDDPPRGELTPDEVLRKPVPVETLKATLASLLQASRR